MKSSVVIGVLLACLVVPLGWMLWTTPTGQINVASALVDVYAPSNETEKALAQEVAGCVAEGEKAQALVPLRERKESACVEKVLLGKNFATPYTQAAMNMRMHTRSSQPRAMPNHEL